MNSQILSPRSEPWIGESYPWINLDLVFRLKKYRRLRLGDHITAMRQQNEMILNVRSTENPVFLWT